MTYGLDTSALLRLLVGLPEGLAQKVNDRLSCLIEEGHKIHISKLVLSEAYFALQTHYDLTKDQAIESLISLRTVPGFVLDSSVAEVFATPRLGHARPGFVDHLIVADYVAGDETTISCEKSFRKLVRTEVVLEDVRCARG